jgi:hypothetical protein
VKESLVGFIATVVVAAVGLHVVNKVLERTGLLENAVRAGVDLVDQGLTAFAQARVTPTPGQRNGG